MYHQQLSKIRFNCFKDIPKRKKINKEKFKNPLAVNFGKHFWWKKNWSVIISIDGRVLIQRLQGKENSEGNNWKDKSLDETLV